MIKANEVRLGNYYDHDGEVKQITPNTITEVWKAERSWCKEIPLTEEWLLRLGFEKCTNGYWCEKELINVKLFEKEISEVYMSGGDTDLVMFNEFKFVHQLQNLYFALTGEELTIKN